MAEELSAQAENMNGVMQFFTLDEQNRRLLTAPGDSSVSSEGAPSPGRAVERPLASRARIGWAAEEPLSMSASGPKETGIALPFDDDSDFEEM